MDLILFKHALRNSLIPVITYLGPLTAGIITVIAAPYIGWLL